MKYHGTVEDSEHRYIIEGEHGYVPMITLKVDSISFKTEFYLDPEQAREMARHLIEAAATAELPK